MKHSLSAIICVSAIFMCASVRAQDDNQASERIDPTLETTADNVVSYSAYRFLDLERNHLQMNNADWSALRSRFEAACAGDTTFNVVYLGDSHIQADFGGSVLRSRLADEVGSAGRGIIIPFRIAGTNQPVDYTITSTGSTLTSRLLKQPWVTDMPFTGIGVQPSSGSFTLHITSQQPFDRIRLLYSGVEPRIQALYGSDVSCAIDHELHPGASAVTTMPQTDVHLRLADAASCVIGGIVLQSADAGSMVHSIGNNGATYSTYNQIARFGPQLAQLSPDLIIIALGTNEAFGTLDESVMYADIDILVNNIRQANPESRIMLVTPAECFRKRYRWRRGRRRAVGQTVNNKVKRARNVVERYGREHSLPVYDTYAIVGGDGAAARMKAAGVLGSDGVHYTSQGYKLQGSLLADALLEALRNSENRNPENNE